MRRSRSTAGRLHVRQLELGCLEQQGILMRQHKGGMAITLALVLVACGSGADDGANSAAPKANGGGGTAAAAQKTDPCSLLTAEEVGEALGDKIVATTPSEGSCKYDTEDAQAASVTLELNQTDAAGQMEIARKTAGVLKGMGEQAAKEGGAAGQDVNAMLSESGEAPKVGDEAFFGPNTQLSVRKGNSYIAIQPPIMRSRMSGGNPLMSSEEKKKIAITLAQKAVARLP
jgi:hypothetical protein